RGARRHGRGGDARSGCAAVHLPERPSATGVRRDRGQLSPAPRRPDARARAARGRAREAAGQPAAGSAECRVHLQEPARRPRGTADRGGGAEGLARRRGAVLRAARQLHRERRARPRGGRAGIDGDRPAGGVGAEWGMAGARGAARRQLVGRSLHRRNRVRRTWTLPRVPWRVLWMLVPLAGLWVAAPPIVQAVRTHPYFAVRDVVIHHRGRLPAADLRTALGRSGGGSIWGGPPAGAGA